MNKTMQNIKTVNNVFILVYFNTLIFNILLNIF